MRRCKNILLFIFQNHLFDIKYNTCLGYSLATPPIDPVNTLREKLETNSKFSEDVVENVQRKYSKTSDHRKSLIEQEREK